MPSTIPYDPSLVLTSVVSEAALKNVEAIAQAQAPVDAAQDALNSLISSKRSLEMTKTELRNLNIDIVPVDVELKKLDADIGKAAAGFASAKMAAEPQIQKLRAEIRKVHANVESPVDYLKTEIKTMPLAADSLNMDVQYFSFDSNSQDATSFAAQIASYVSESASMIFAPTESTKVANAASTQVSRQVSQHKIEGTLVLSVNCTHKNANVLAPFVLHVDKAIKVWNRLFPGSKLDPTDRKSMMKVAMNPSQEDKEKYSIISGTTFGSSFVGMVHVLNSSNTNVGDTLTAAASSLQASMDTGGWFAKMEGKTGVDAKFATDVKNLLSQQNITSHVTLITMGVIPSMVANDTKIAVESFVDFDPQKNMAQVMAIQNATDNEQSTVQSLAEASRTGEQSSEVEGKKMQSALTAMAAIDDGQNKILDINSMMKALEDYLAKASEGDCGVPINYYIKDIDVKMLAEMWVAKYYPGQYMAIKYDDTEGAGPAANDAGGQEKAKL
ncbi:hypothetical protein KCU91_g915, partial [Aureobasidium melanogenum]